MLKSKHLIGNIGFDLAESATLPKFEDIPPRAKETALACRRLALYRKNAGNEALTTQTFEEHRVEPAENKRRQKPENLEPGAKIVFTPLTKRRDLERTR